MEHEMKNKNEIHARETDGEILWTRLPFPM